MTRLARLPLLAGFAFALSACSGEETVVGNQTSAGTGPGAGTVVTVHITDAGFEPRGVVIQRGATVRFINDTNFSHSVSPEVPSQQGAWTASGISQQGQQIDIVMNTAGAFGFFCASHSGTERGTILVQ